MSALDPLRYGLDENATYPLNGILHLPQSGGDRSQTGEGTDTSLPLGKIQEHLMGVYVDRIGYEFQHCGNKSERLWFAHHVETGAASPGFAEIKPERKRRLWDLVSRSEEFDRFMAKKFPSVKRYGEGWGVAADTRV